MIKSVSYNDLTLVIPVRIDSEERLRNLYLVLRYYQLLEGLKIIVLEADTVSKVDCPAGVRKLFIEDADPVFHRTKYINVLCGLVDTPYLGVWDADVLIPADRLDQAIGLLERGEADMVLPYDGHAYNISYDLAEAYVNGGRERTLLDHCLRIHSMFGRHSCGGAFIVDKSAYVEAGGENESIVAWGPEDLERYKRWEIGGYQIVRLDGFLFHVSHPRKENSRYYSPEIARQVMQALFATCRKMSLK